MANEGYHESEARLTPETMDRHRAIVSLMEELEAVDWYDQRVDAAENEELREILAHNRDEEKEHAAMVLEWLRRCDARFDEELRAYLFTEGKITALEEDATGEGGEAGQVSAPSDGSLGIGSLRAGSE